MRLRHPRDILVGGIVFHRALPVLVLEALVTGDTPVNLLFRKLDKLSADTFLFQLMKKAAYQDDRVPILPRASVKTYDLYLILLSDLRV